MAPQNQRIFTEAIILSDNFKKYDVFHSYLVEDADYAGEVELPCIKTSIFLPNKLVTFSKAVSKTWQDYDCWIHFYEHDFKFERLWNNPKRYIDKIKKFKGVIAPDFSVYRNMPLVMQEWNTYRNRALAHWLCNNGIEVIPNIRTADERSFAFCFDGIEKHKTIAVGTHGCIKQKRDWLYFELGLKKLVEVLTPKTIIVYGAAPDMLFGKYKDMGVDIICFESEFAVSRKQVKR